MIHVCNFLRPCKLLVGLMLFASVAVCGSANRIRPQVRRPQRLRRIIHENHRTLTKIRDTYGYTHRKPGFFSPSRGKGGRPVKLPKATRHRAQWRPPLPPTTDRTTKIWEEDNKRSETRHGKDQRDKEGRAKLLHSHSLEHRVFEALHARCTQGPTLTFRTYRRDIAENFRYLVGAVLYSLGTNSSLVLRPPNPLDVHRTGKKSGKDSDLGEREVLFGCFSLSKEDISPQHKPHFAHRAFLLTKTMQGCFEPVLGTCPHPALVPSVLSSLENHHFNTKNTVIDWNVWEDKNDMLGVYGNIMELSVNEHLSLPSIQYSGPRWDITRTVAHHIWRLSPHMKRLLHHQLHKMKLNKEPGTSPSFGVHVTSLRSNQAHFAKKHAGDDDSKNGDSQHSAPVGLYIVALERAWEKYHSGKEKLLAPKKEKVLFLYASHYEDTAAFEKEAKGKGWKILTMPGDSKKHRSVPHLKTISQICSIEIFKQIPYFIGAASNGLSWTTQAIRNFPLSNAISLDDPWGQRLLR